MKKTSAYADEYIRKIRTSGEKYIVDTGIRPISSVKEMLETSAAAFENNTAFWQKFKGDKEYSQIKYKQVLEDVNALGTSLISRGHKGDCIAVIGENSYFWAISYLAVIGGAGVVVPIDKELGEQEIRGYIESSDAKCVFFSPKFEDMFKRLSEERELTLVRMGEPGSDENVLSTDMLVEEGKALLAEGNREYLDAEIDVDEMAVLLFTSGTTGVSKGVMLSNKNICCDLMGAPHYIKVQQDDIFFSVLPMHHTYECTCGFLMPLYRGASIGYCQGLKYIQKNLREIQPTFFLGVPLIFEKLYSAIWKNIRKQNKEKAVNNILKAGKVLSFGGKNPLGFLLKDIKAVFGGRLRVVISGGAAIDPQILDFFSDLGYLAVQGYGLTECAPMAALNPGKKKYVRNSSVGHVLPNQQVKIADAGSDGVGEICIKGDNVMLGYYNMPEETAETIVDGWFYTGDLGYVDDDDYVYITGRKKNVIITPNGKNVYPEELEYLIGLSDLVEECFVWPVNDENEQNKQIAATIKPDEEELVRRLGDEYRTDDVEKVIAHEIDLINEELPHFKQISKVVVRFREFDKTTSHKIKRFSDDNKE